MITCCFSSAWIRPLFGFFILLAFPFLNFGLACFPSVRDGKLIFDSFFLNPLTAPCTPVSFGAGSLLAPTPRPRLGFSLALRTRGPKVVEVTGSVPALGETTFLPLGLTRPPTNLPRPLGLCTSSSTGRGAGSPAGWPWSATLGRPWVGDARILPLTTLFSSSIVSPSRRDMRASAPLLSPWLARRPGGLGATGAVQASDLPVVTGKWENV